MERCYFHKRPHSELLDGRASHIFWGGHTSTHNGMIMALTHEKVECVKGKWLRAEAWVQEHRPRLL